MPRVILQAGHFPQAGGAPGEAVWTYELARRIADRLERKGIATGIIGDFYSRQAPAAVWQDWDLFLALHYDAAIYAARGEANSGCFADRSGNPRHQTVDADRFIALWEHLYPTETGIPLAKWRSNPNTTAYYAYVPLAHRVPCVLIEHGVGAPVGTGGYPPGDDAVVLHGGIDHVADVDAAAVLRYFGLGLDEEDEDMTRIKELQATVDELASTNSALSDQVTALREEIRSLREETVPVLEAQIAVAVDYSDVVNIDVADLKARLEKIATLAAV